MYTILAFAFLILVWFTGTALAADVAADPNTGELLRQIFDAVVHGQWWIAGSALVVAACALARKYMPDSWKAGTRGDVIGVATVFVMAFAGAVATTMAAPGASMSAQVALTALKVGVGAIGGWTIAHKIIGWIAAWDKCPAWLKAALALVGTVIGSNAVKKAEEAGDAAVAADPAPGMSGNGTIREVE